MTGTLYTVTKKPNSTAQPTGTGTGITFRLKGACSVQAPVLSLWSGGPVNLFSSDDVIRGFYMSSSGTLATSATYCVSDYIPITYGTTYTLDRVASVGSSQRYINYYDVNLNRLGNITGPTASPDTFSITNSSARYIRFNYLAANETQVQITGGTVLRQPSGNYIHIPAFGRYYWITDMTYDLGEWTIRCSCDVLATYKSAIGSSSQYVIRSASSYDNTLIDSLYPTKGTPSLATTRASSSLSMNDGLYIVGVVGAPNNSASPMGLVYYAMTRAEFVSLLTYINTASSIETFSAAAVTNLQTAIDYVVGAIQSGIADIIQWFLQPGKFVQTCTWIPVTTSDFLATVAVTEVPLGGLASVPLNTRQITGNPMAIVSSVTVPDHPLKATRGDWVEDAPYAEQSLYVPGVGTIPLPTSYVRGGRTVSVSIEISAVDGTCRAEVTCYGNVIGTYQGKLGVSVQMNASSINIAGAAVNASSALMKASEGNYVGAAQGLMSAADCAAPALHTIGSDGGKFPLTDQYITLSSVYWSPADEDITSHGRPLCQVKTISSLSGYILCENAEIGISGTAEEADAIINFMNGGFYYE